MKIINSDEFDRHWQPGLEAPAPGDEAEAAAEIIAAVRYEGDRAVRRYAARFDKASPENPEVPPELVLAAGENLARDEPALTAALEFAAGNIRRFAEWQRAQLREFEAEIAPGLFTGQRVIPVRRAAVYAPGGRFPLISSVLMGLIPAQTAGVAEVLVASPPGEDGLPDRRVMAAAAIAGGWKNAGTLPRLFALGGAQAIAALALGTETVPRVDVVAGPGNKYVAAAKRLLSGEVGIDFVAGPTDVLIIAGEGEEPDWAVADRVAADMLAQAEHDPDARARALVPRRRLADQIAESLEKRLASLSTAAIARASLDAGGLIVCYRRPEEAIRIANLIAPEHLELQTPDTDRWVPELYNYGSLFIGSRAAEVLGDYSAGINHTLPTAGSARFTGGLSVRHFLKTPTTLRCAPGEAYYAALEAAERIARAEGLAAHGESAAHRRAFPGRPV
jgi:histidinol dehydrogenase